MKDPQIIALAKEAGLMYIPEPNSPLMRIVREAVEIEREACAQVCDERQTPGTGSVAILGGAADAIRARGKK